MVAWGYLPGRALTGYLADHRIYGISAETWKTGILGIFLDTVHFECIGITVDSLGISYARGEWHSF